MTRRRRAALAGLLVTVLLALVPAGAASAGYGEESQFQAAGLSPAVYIRPDGRSCTVSSRAAVREYGKNGVTRFKISYELRTPYDTGNIPFFNRSTGYTHSNRFPNDARNFDWRLDLQPNVLVFQADKRFALWAKIVGDRGRWRRDFTRHIRLGEVYCPSTVDDGDVGVYDPGGYPIVEGGS